MSNINTYQTALRNWIWTFTLWQSSDNRYCHLAIAIVRVMIFGVQFNVYQNIFYILFFIKLYQGFYFKILTVLIVLLKSRILHLYLQFILQALKYDLCQKVTRKRLLPIQIAFFVFMKSLYCECKLYVDFLHQFLSLISDSKTKTAKNFIIWYY